MYVRAVTDCLLIFAAAGYFNYLKSSYLYVQTMNDLVEKHPAVLEKCETGFHVVRRKNQYWAGLGSAFVIEQTLVRPLRVQEV